MLPKEILTSNRSASGLVLEGLRDTTLELLATNLRTAAARRGKSIHPTEATFLAFDQPEDSKHHGIIVLLAHYRDTKGRGDSVYIAVLVTPEGVPQLDQHWEPVCKRHLLAFGREQDHPYTTYLRVRAESNTLYANSTQLNPDEYFVPDPDLLCRYLVGEINEDALREVAATTIAEASAREELPKSKRN